MTSAVQPIQSMPLNPVDLVQAYTPSQIDSTSRAGEVASGASGVQPLSSSEAEVTFNRLMSPNGVGDSSQVTQMSEKLANVSSTSQTADAQKTTQTSATAGASSSSAVGDKVSNASSTNQTTDTQKTSQTSATGGTSSSQTVEQVFQKLPQETQTAILDLIANLQKNLTAAQYQVLKDGWAGKQGTDLQLGITYFYWFQNFNAQSIQLLNFLDDALKNQ